MTPADGLSLILRRLDEIERKLDRMMEELRTPTAIGYRYAGAIFQGRTEATGLDGTTSAPIPRWHLRRLGGGDYATDFDGGCISCCFVAYRHRERRRGGLPRRLLCNRLPVLRSLLGTPS